MIIPSKFVSGPAAGKGEVPPGNLVISNGDISLGDIVFSDGDLN